MRGLSSTQAMIMIVMILMMMVIIITITLAVKIMMMMVMTRIQNWRWQVDITSSPLDSSSNAPLSLPYDELPNKTQSVNICSNRNPQFFTQLTFFGEMCSPKTPLSIVLYHFLINFARQTFYSPMPFFIPESLLIVLLLSFLYFDGESFSNNKAISCQKEVEKIAS